ncbi:MAG: hypothetical protein ACR2HH_05055 [Chthoniobacterales bacterium]
MQNSQRKSFRPCLVVLLAAALLPQTGSSLDLVSHVAAGGGGASSGGNFVVQATAGQAAAGTSPVAGRLSMQVGFWPAAFPGRTLEITSIIHLVNGHISLGGVGVPGATYTVQASPDLNAGTFAGIGTTTSDANGIWHYDDASSAGQVKRFYRVTFP